MQCLPFTQTNNLEQDKSVPTPLAKTVRSIILADKDRICALNHRQLISESFKPGSLLTLGKNFDPQGGTENVILISHSSFGLIAKLNRSPRWLQRLFSKTLQSVLNKARGSRRKLRASALVVLLYIGFRNSHVTAENAGPQARSVSPQSIASLSTAHRVAVYSPSHRCLQPSYEVVTSPKRLAERLLDGATPSYHG
jgi:hypothetical protein